jgi:hypothetical protein
VVLIYPQDSRFVAGMLITRDNLTVGDAFDRARLGISRIHDSDDMFEFLQFLSLLILPGAWCTFAPRITFLGFSQKLIVGATLSPLVLFVQFYLASWSGLSFSATAQTLSLCNLPVVFFMFRDRAAATMPSWSTVAWSIAILAIPLTLLAFQYHDPQIRAITGHGWMHSDSIYSLANGHLVPEEVDMVGARHAYPWGPHVYQGLLSSVLDAPPSSTYHWTNIAWFLVVFLALAWTVRELGGNRFAQVSAILWLSFAPNCLGYLLTFPVLRDLPLIGGNESGIWGTARYSLWMGKYFFYTAMVLGLGVCAAMVFVAIKAPVDRKEAKQSVYVIGLLTLCLGIMYPIMLPGALAVLGGKGLYLLMRRSEANAAWVMLLSSYSVIVVVTMVAAQVQISFLSADRINHSMWVSPVSKILLQIPRALLTLSILLVGYLLVLRRNLRPLPESSFVLGLAGLLCAGLFVCVSIVWDDEYKFLHAACIMLAPFPALAVQAHLSDLGIGRKILAAGVALLMLVTPAVIKLKREWPFLPPTPIPMLDLSGFDLRLAKSDPRRPMFDAIRTRTDKDTIVVVESSVVHLPTLTQRSLYITPHLDQRRMGVNMLADRILDDLKGFDPARIASRRAIVHTLYRSTVTAARGAALSELKALRRPLLILLDTTEHAVLLDWLAQTSEGAELTRNGRTVAWLVK